ncbi:MAG TPA: hypothetical protein VFN35_17225 [Ktedonobacteraceae bacterium]|nr:hypothetical protein [Ktedonobacteraceae bacterium]
MLLDVRETSSLYCNQTFIYGQWLLLLFDLMMFMKKGSLSRVATSHSLSNRVQVCYCLHDLFFWLLQGQLNVHLTRVAMVSQLLP